MVGRNPRTSGPYRATRRWKTETVPPDFDISVQHAHGYHVGDGGVKVNVRPEVEAAEGGDYFLVARSIDRIRERSHFGGSAPPNSNDFASSGAVKNLHITAGDSRRYSSAAPATTLIRECSDMA